MKAGLATSGQAKKAENQKRAEERAQRHGKSNKKNAAPATKAPSDKDKARQALREKAARDKAKAKEKNDKYAQRALRAEIKQIILQNDKRTKVSDADALPYNFLHGKKIKRIYVSKDEREQLSSGKLIVVNNDGIYHFVLPEVAEKISARDPKRVIVAHQANNQGEKAADEPMSEDEKYYAQFEVPDDLDW